MNRTLYMLATVFLMCAGSLTMNGSVWTAGDGLGSAVASRFQPASDPRELVNQARKLDLDGKQDEAVALYRRALAIDPKLFDAHLGIGRALDLKGDYVEARKHLVRAIELATPETVSQALGTIAVSFAFEANAAEAAKYFQKQFDRQMNAQSLDAAAATANALARVYLESGDSDNAEKWYTIGYNTAKRSANLPPDQVDLWEMRWRHAEARIAARRGKAAEARIHMQAVKALTDKGTLDDTQKIQYPYLAGYVSFYAGDYDTAIAELTRADQTDPFILVLIAQAYEKKHDGAKAAEYYAKVLASNAHSINNAFARPLARKRLQR